MNTQRQTAEQGSLFKINKTGDVELVRFWAAKMLLVPGAWRKGWCRHEKCFEHQEILDLLNFKASKEGRLRQPPAALNLVLKQYELSDLLEQDDVYRNLARLGERLSLTVTERYLLTFACYLHANVLVNRISDLIPLNSRRALMPVLAWLLDRPEAEVSKALSSSGVLNQAGLLRVSTSNSFSCSGLSNMIDIDSELYDLLNVPDVPGEVLAGLFYRVADASELGESDYLEMADEVHMLKTLLTRLKEKPVKGVNILIYGPPGTGKTELVKVLGEALELRLAMVPETDKEGDSLGENVRLSRYVACQRVLAQDHNTCVVFDEAEGVICSPVGFGLFFSSNTRVSKGSMTHILETNPRPTFWISNRVEMDPAYLRRFTHVLRLDNPGLEQRKRLANQVLAGTPVSDSFKASLTRLDNISPAVLQASLDFATLAGQGPDDVERLMRHNLNARLQAMGRTERVNSEHAADLPWRAECLRASEDVATLLTTLRPDVPVRFCLSGPPGTGKTAWGKQLADHLGKPLMVRQASDLLDMYVGQSEKLIADAFHQAERDGAVLLIDEADSFIGNRQHARQHWEVSQVNQFLRSLETFSGLFVATTNLLDKMDPAAMRRFDFIVQFDYLDTDGALLLLRDLAAAYDIALPEDTILHAMLEKIPMLTPGEFAVIHRRLRVLREYPDAAGLLALLQEACAHKQQGSNPIGFHASLQ